MVKLTARSGTASPEASVLGPGIYPVKDRQSHSHLWRPPPGATRLAT